MNDSETNFVRNVVLSDNVPMDLKIGGLKILLATTERFSNNIISNFDVVRKNNAALRFGLSASQWDEIQDCIDNKRKIPAIRLLKEAVDSLGLNDAKVAIEDDRYFRQPQY